MEEPQYVRAGTTVKDVFTHNKWLASPDDELVRTFSKILNKDILMANVGKDAPLRLQQNTGIYMQALLGMALRDPENLLDFFFFRYYSWQTELGLTRTKQGAERKMQAAAARGYQTNEILPGYGSEMIGDEEEQGFFDALRNKLQPKKQG